MTLKDYRQYTERELRRQKKTKRSAKFRKDLSESESDRRPTKKSKKGKETAKVMDSEGLDSSGSGDSST